MKKITIILSSLILAISINNIYVFAATTTPKVSEDSAVIMDAATGDILFSKNMDTAYPPASTTKVMTALLTLELSKLDTVVTVGKNPPKVAAGTSNISLIEGEQLTVKDLLYGLILQSANDSAETLAEYIGGTSVNFATMMNARAKHPEFKKISTTAYYAIPPNNKYPKGHPVSNENKIVTRKSYAIPGYEGSKTGYTNESLFSFTAVASRNGQKLIVSLVHGKEKSFYSETQELFDYGFNNFELVKLYNKDDKVLDYKVADDSSIPLLASEDYYFVRKKGSKDVPQYTISPIDLKNKVFKAGDKLLTLDFTLGDKILVPLNLNSSVDHTTKATLIKPLTDTKGSNIKYYIILIISIIILFFALIIKKKRFRRKRSIRYKKYL